LSAFRYGDNASLDQQGARKSSRKTRDERQGHNLREGWSVLIRLTLTALDIGWTAGISEEIMAIPKNDQHKQYARYAEHCLKLVPRIPDQEYRSVQREMAAEWLKLADAVIHPLKPTKSSNVK
jgi:hypothetical protein